MAAGWGRIEREASNADYAGLNVTPPGPDQAGLNAKRLNLGDGDNQQEDQSERCYVEGDVLTVKIGREEL